MDPDSILYDIRCPVQGRGLSMYQATLGYELGKSHHVLQPFHAALHLNPEFLISSDHIPTFLTLMRNIFSLLLLLSES
jgi:hypothetical protein